MVPILKEHRMAQLALFGEHPAVPHWSDLTQSTRNELVRLLAQLLLGVQANGPSRAPQSHGGCDE
jgi:hypothetical protein